LLLELLIVYEIIDYFINFPTTSGEHEDDLESQSTNLMEAIVFSACNASVANDYSSNSLSFYHFIEKQVLILQDSTLAVAGVTILSQLAQGYKLEYRCASIAWQLFNAVFTSSLIISSYNARSERVESLSLISQLDILTFKLNDISCSLCSPNLTLSISEKQAIKVVDSLFKSVILKHRSADAMLAAKQMLWLLWWKYEKDNKAKLAGCANVLKQFFASLPKSTSIDKSQVNLKKRKSLNGMTKSSKPFDSKNHFFDFYLVLSMLPMLLLDSRSQLAFEVNNHHPCGYYGEYVDVVSLLSWVINSFIELEVDPDSFSSKHLEALQVFMVKLCRALVISLDCCLHDFTSLRNEGTCTIDTDDNAVVSMRDDLLGLNYLKEFLCWTFVMSQSIASLVRHLKAKRVTLSSYKSFGKVVLLLEESNEKLVQKILKAFKSHSLDISDEEVKRKQGDCCRWSAALRASVADFTRSKSSAFDVQPAADSLLLREPAMQRRTNNDVGELWNSANSDIDDDDNDEDVAWNVDFEAVINNAPGAGSGWGLY